jgi:two-component sensor histidine kinase
VQRLREAITRAARGEFVRYEVELQGAGQTAATIDFSLKPIFSPSGQVTLLIPEGRDITERKRAEEALQTSLEEKEALLKEVHHRVKNNLQIISSLLNLQAREILSPEVQAFVRDTQSRIHAMALLHETLYGSGNLARVSFRRYVNSVCTYVARTYSSDSLNVRMQPDIVDVSMPLDQAIPAGLIINELVSNALKHAFAGRAGGEISIQLQVADEHHYVLRVMDNGVGLAATTDPQTTGTLGLRLVENLVRQLEGVMTVERNTGTAFQIVFPRSSA